MFDDPLSPSWTPLLEAAWAAREHAHAPYSHFQVGAALLTDAGEVVAGCNVENAAYPVTLCAERGALSAAVASGLRPGGLVAAVVVTDVAELTPPCGACRQILWEFCGDVELTLSNLHGKTESVQLGTLFPRAFDASFL